MTDKTIRAFVLRRLGEGASSETVHAEAAVRFPYHCVGWLYILKLKRESVNPTLTTRS